MTTDQVQRITERLRELAFAREESAFCRVRNEQGQDKSPNPTALGDAKTLREAADLLSVQAARLEELRVALEKLQRERGKEKAALEKQLYDAGWRRT